jgi:hypothetical protein
VQHRVAVHGLWIDEHPVTVAEFRRFVKATGYQPGRSGPPIPPTTPASIPQCSSRVRWCFTGLPDRSRSSAGGTSSPSRGKMMAKTWQGESPGKPDARRPRADLARQRLPAERLRPVRHGRHRQRMGVDQRLLGAPSRQRHRPPLLRAANPRMLSPVQSYLRARRPGAHTSPAPAGSSRVARTCAPHTSACATASPRAKARRSTPAPVTSGSAASATTSAPDSHAHRAAGRAWCRPDRHRRPARLRAVAQAGFRRTGLRLGRSRRLHRPDVSAPASQLGSSERRWAPGPGQGGIGTTPSPPSGLSSSRNRSPRP